MRILLVQPPLTLSPEVQPPVGLCVLAAHLRREGHWVRIVDLDLEERSAESPSAYLATLTRAVREHEPDIVGVTSMFNNSLHAERLIRATKAIDSQIVTVGGGSHFGALPAAALDRIPELDYAIRGEGEIAFAQLVRTVEQGTFPDAIPRVCSRTAVAAHDQLQSPLLDLASVEPTWSSLGDAIDLGRYVATIPAESPRKTIYIEAGRGCPFACSFCATAPFWQRRYRVKRVDVIVAEMRYLHSMYGYDAFMLVHDLLTVDRRFMDEFCRAMYTAALPVEWTANHRADLRLGDLPPKMRSAGCVSVFMGMETASDRLQHEVDKGLTREQIVSTVTALRDVGITSTCSFIIGFPSETASEVSDTLRLGVELKILGADPVQIHRLRRWPPAALAADELEAAFDLESLRLEYPSPAIPPEDVATIAADPTFFMGYFTPASAAGSPYQLAQLELFFSHMLPIMPISLAVLASFHGARLVESYYRALAIAGPVHRDQFQSAIDARATLRSLLKTWIELDESLVAWQRTLLRGCVAYEAARTAFMLGVEPEDEGFSAQGAEWAVLPVSIDIPRLLRQLGRGDHLSANLCTSGHVALSRAEDGSVQAFGLAPSFADRVRDHDAEAIATLRSA